MNDLEYLSVEDLLEIGKSIIPNFQIRDLGLLQLAALRPKLMIYGAQAYLSFPEKVAALMDAVVRNRALIDGNNQLAWASGKVFCLLNGKDLNLTAHQAAELITEIAAGDYETAEIVEIIGSAIK